MFKAILHEIKGILDRRERPASLDLRSPHRYEGLPDDEASEPHKGGIRGSDIAFRRQGAIERERLRRSRVHRRKNP